MRTKYRFCVFSISFVSFSSYVAENARRPTRLLSAFFLHRGGKQPFFQLLSHIRSLPYGHRFSQGGVPLGCLDGFCDPYGILAGEREAEDSQLLLFGSIELNGPASKTVRSKYVVSSFLVSSYIAFVYCCFVSVEGNMLDSASDRAVVPLYSDVARRLQQMGAPVIITEAIDKQAILASLMEKRNLTYLSLPPVLAVLAADPIYQKALYWGRGLYYDALHAVDDAGKLVRVPVPFDRPSLFEYIKETLTLDDPRIAIAVSLAWRVGLVVGFLSGVAVSQPDDAQAALLVLVALVAPLLSTAAGDTHEITSFKRSLLKRGKKR